MSVELWKRIPGYERDYEVSTLGNVQSLNRAVFCSGSVKGEYWSFKKGRKLKPGRMASGHMSVALGKGNSRCVHELVLLAFVGAPLKGQECRHINGNPADNRLENLVWGTRSDNSRDKVRMREQYKLSVEDVIAIKTALKTPYKGINRDLARQFGVSFVTISAIKHGRQHGWVLVG